MAVKIPHRDQLSPAETEKFLREARAAAQLRHPRTDVYSLGVILYELLDLGLLPYCRSELARRRSR